VTNHLHAIETCQQLKEYGFQPSHLLAEPMGRNTAPAIALAARYLAEKDPEEVMGIYPADHIIHNPDEFVRAIEPARRAAEQGFLVTIGIQPARPETGYGYIKQGAPLPGTEGAFRVGRFVEKPDLDTARAFLSEGNYYWNSGMFFARVSTFLEELERYLPDLYSHLEDLVKHIAPQPGNFPYLGLDAVGKDLFSSLNSISIDYGVLERSERAVVVPSSFEWNDVGSWSALQAILPLDPGGNIVSDHVVALDCTESVIQSDGRLIAALGLKDMIVVDTPDALLVCDKNRAQEVRNVVGAIRKKFPDQARTHTRVYRPWGSFTVLETQPTHVVKRIEVLPGGKLSLQSHNHRSEHWTVVQGTAEVWCDNERVMLEENHSIFISQGRRHRLANPGEIPLIVIEVQTGDRLDENDITRYEDAYGRC